MAECLALVCSDGQRLEADIAMLAPLRTVVNLLEHAGPDRCILLPGVNGEALSTIMALLRGQMDFSALDSLDDARYFALTLACNYLEYRSALGYLLGGLIARFMALDDATFVATIGQPYEDLLLTACVFLSKEQAAAFHRRFVSHFGTDTFSDTFQTPVLDFIGSWYVALTGFSWAAANGRTEVVALLLATPGRGIDPSAEDNAAIRYAASHGHTDVVVLLLAEPLERGIDPSANNNWAIQLAAFEGHAKVVALLLTTPGRGIDPSVEDNWAIRLAAGSGHADVVALLLAEPRERGIDPSANHNEAIHWAVKEGHTAVVALLLSQGTGRGINPSAGDNWAIRTAAAKGHAGVVALLLAEPRERGVDPSAVNNAAIRIAAENGHADVVALLEQ